jgi:glutamate dehydrogenase (NAD(P)+)
MTNDAFRFSDDLGPAKIVHIYHPELGLKAIVVVDNVAAGPAIGGTRMAPDVSLEECFRLARAMTLKNAAAGLRHGGAKSVIFADPAMDKARKETLIRAFAQALRELADYIPGPDMGTNEEAMAWVFDEIQRSVGLPREIGGIPLDEIGATGWGLAAAGDEAQTFARIDLDGARVVVQGFGAVGRHAARFLRDKGAVLVGASDSRGAIVAPDGLDVDQLMAHKAAGEPVSSFGAGRLCDEDELIATPCDIWIPAARPDVITRENAGKLDCKLFLQGANIPATREAEAILHDRGILCIPDFIANAGGVICAAVEYRGGGQVAAMSEIEEKVRHNTREVLELAQRENCPPRDAAEKLAASRVKRAMALRRWGHSN